MTAAQGPLFPDFTLVRPDATIFRLSSLGGRPVVLIFLRHLG